VFTFACGDVPHARNIIEMVSTPISKITLSINYLKMLFKMAVPARRLRPRGAATAFEPTRAGIKRIRKVEQLP
jgi:hypothetical protein